MVEEMDKFLLHDREVVVIGDLHLVDLEERKKGSRLYKDPLFSIDKPFSDFLRWIDSGSRGPLALVINGDFIDFDLIFSGDGIDTNTAKRKFDRVIYDHRLLFESLVSFLADGKNRLVLVLGNHDLEFLQVDFLDHFFLQLEMIARENYLNGLDFMVLKRRISIEPLFYWEKGLFYVEHGDRFDQYGASPRPFIYHGMTFLSLGSLSNRYILRELPTFNPFMSEQVIKGLGGYLGHLFSHYPIPPYRLPYRYLKGAIRSFFMSLKERKSYLLDPFIMEKEDLKEVSRRMDMQEDVVQRLMEIGKESVILRSPMRVFRTLWLDRVSIFFLFSMILLAQVISGQSTWIVIGSVSLMVILYILYDTAMGNKDVLMEKRGLGKHAGEILGILQIPFVILGHTHHPEDRVIDGRRYLNCGSWAQIFEDREASRPWSKGRTYVHIRIHGGCIEADLMQWSMKGPVKLGI